MWLRENPKMYFDENPTERKEFRPTPTPQPKKEEKTNYIPFSLIQQSESTNNTLMDYLRKYFKDEDLNKVTADYHLGSTQKREIIFPQIDKLSMCHTGKVMNYDTDGHRIKGKIDAIDWLHARLMKKQTNIRLSFTTMFVWRAPFAEKAQGYSLPNRERESRYYRLYCIPSLHLGIMWWETRSYTGKMQSVDRT